MASAPAQIPTSFGHELRACLRCRLVKTYDQFRESGCENYPFLQRVEDQESVVECTTPNFNGIISVIDPTRSWAARWLRIGKFVPGVYTLAVSKALPEEMQAVRISMCHICLLNVSGTSKYWLCEISNMKYVLITGVISGLGKDVTASSIGVVLKACGLHVTSIKIDPYLNINASFPSS